MRGPASFIDRLIGWLEWPVAALSLLFLPGMLYAAGQALLLVVEAPDRFYLFAIGALVVTGVWYLVIRNHSSRAWLILLEHELTHALVAWATLHKVIGVGAALRSGGHLRYHGRGNWLIAIAPHFLPLFALVTLMLSIYWSVGAAPIAQALLGGFTASYIIGTWSKEYRHHGDIREAGRLFCLLFLPVANSFVGGVILSHVAGEESLTAFLDHVRAPTRWFANALFVLFS